MESLIIPGIIGGITGIYFLIWHLRRFYNEDLCDLGKIILVGVLILSLFICPPIRNLASRSDAIAAEAYYTNIVEPHIVAEFPDYVVVDSSIAPAIWQSGDDNLAVYNSYLATMRYWDSVPIIGSVIYPPPSNLKFVKVENEEVNNV